mmetsp:Transcript_35330/g.63656  ORF Transcript_35330/g.63656 Transcript_35330/m.63656 type:complete len:324 (-) Transcript_35330:100-1071(-)
MFTLSVETVLFTLFGDPFPKGAVTRVVLRDNAVSILFLKLQQLLIPIIPISPIPNLPNKSHFIQPRLPLLRHQIRLPLHLRLPLPTLIRHPLSQLGILGVQTWDPDIPMFILVLREIFEIFLPKSVPADIPLKVDGVQHGNTIGVQEGGRGLVFLVELVVFPLRLDPVVQQAVARIVVGDVQISPLGLKQQHLVEHGVPALLPSPKVAGKRCWGVGVQVQDAAAGWCGRRGSVVHAHVENIFGGDPAVGVALLAIGRRGSILHRRKRRHHGILRVLELIGGVERLAAGKIRLGWIIILGTAADEVLSPAGGGRFDFANLRHVK